MSRQLSKEEWIFWFNKYESNNFSWEEFFTCTHKKETKDAKVWFRKKYCNYILYGKDIIISMTGKKSTGRPKKQKEISWDDFTKEELIEIAKRYKEITKDKKKSEKDKESSSFSFSKTKISWMLGISRSGLYYSRNSTSKRDPIIERMITKIFHDNNGIFGRDRIAAISGINYKRVGRYMKALGLHCKIRVAKRKAESKNTNIKFKDLVKRRYNKKNVIATDVSYIKTNNGFNYLSVAIDHYTKEVLSWNFSKFNDNELVLKHFKNINLKGKIVHSDHGSQYSSKAFINLSRQKGFKISMSRIGNSLDNREAEYFFSNIKSEWLNHMKILDFKDTKKMISKYIEWYNNKRPQSCLQWKTPKQARMSI